MNKDDSIFVAGHNGLVGSAIVRKLQADGYTRIISVPRQLVDLADHGEVYDLFYAYRPKYVFLAAAMVGGIYANKTKPVDFLISNLVIQNNVIDCARQFNADKVCFLGSSCIYPRDCPQPIKEEYLLSGPLEPTNQAYAIAKIAGIELMQAMHRQYGRRGISLMPTNLYGPNDNYRLNESHVLPAFIRRFHEAVENGSPIVEMWGTGSPRREFLHSDDLADAAVMLMNEYESPEIINVGCGEDVTIRELAELVAEVVGFKGTIAWDTSKPDGTPRKLLDVSKLRNMGWSPKFGLKEGIRSTYEHFRSGGGRR